MSEDALKFGRLADLEKLVSLLDGILKDYAMVQDTLNEVRSNNETRATRNAELREQLEGMKSQVGSTVNKLMSDMLGINSEDVMNDAEINAYLQEAFEKFGENNSARKWKI